MKKLALSLSLVAILSVASYAGDGKAPTKPTQAEQQEMLANNSFEMPSPGALVLALTHNLGNINWSSYIPPVKAKKYTSTEDMVLDLGSRGADAYFLAASKDASNLIAVSTKINYLLNNIRLNGKSLNPDSRKKKLNKIKELVNNKNWGEVLKKINELQNDINLDFAEANQPELKLLNEAGGWIEGYRLAVNGFKNNYKAEATDILLQNDLIDYLINSINSNAKLKSFNKTAQIIKTLQDIKSVLSGAKNNQLTKAQVDSLYNILENAKSYL